MVKNDDVDVEGAGEGSQLFGLSRSNEGRRVELLPFHQLSVDRVGPCGVGQQCQLVE